MRFTPTLTPSLNSPAAMIIFSAWTLCAVARLLSTTSRELTLSRSSCASLSSIPARRVDSEVEALSTSIIWSKVVQEPLMRCFSSTLPNADEEFAPSSISMILLASFTYSFLISRDWILSDAPPPSLVWAPVVTIKLRPLNCLTLEVVSTNFVRGDVAEIGV